MVRAILHVDMDAFYVSVELVRRPELRGQPVVVGGTGRRGVVAAASYEARSYGVFSAMSSSRARQLCPHAVFLAGDHRHYADVSARVMAIFNDVTPLVEPISLDEAFLDVTGARRLHGDAGAIARMIRRRVWETERLTCSVGIAPTKFLAKLATEEAKPKASRTGPIFGPGVHEVVPGDELAFLHPLPVTALWGVGAATHAKLSSLGVQTVADLAALPLVTLTTALGRASGTHLHALAQAIDDREVEPDRETKSISHEETFAHDLSDRSTIDVELVRQADAVAQRLRNQGLAARTATIKVRFGDFTTITRRSTGERPFTTADELLGLARGLMATIDPGQGIRLLGVGVAGLMPDPGEQLSMDTLFSADGPDSDSDVKRAAAADVVDDVRAKFGDGAIGRASATVDGSLRTVRRGAQQWGPDDERAE